MEDFNSTSVCKQTLIQNVCSSKSREFHEKVQFQYRQQVVVDYGHASFKLSQNSLHNINKRTEITHQIEFNLIIERYEFLGDIITIASLNQYLRMDMIFKEEQSLNWESEVINFMREHRNLTVRECIVLYVKTLKDKQWDDYEAMVEQLQREADGLVEQVEEKMVNKK